MAKRRNKNKAPGPVKVIKPENPQKQAAAAPVIEDVPAVPDAPAEASAVEAAHPETATVTDPATESASPAIPIVEMDMQSARGPESEFAPTAPVPEVDDASGALAQAIDVDPSTVTSKPKQFESIRILDVDAATLDLGEQGMTAGSADGTGSGDSYSPVGGRDAVAFDLPEGAEAETAAPDEPEAKGRKSGRKLKLNKLQKHARGAASPDPEPEQAPAAEAAPRRARDPRTSAFAKLADYQNLSLAHVPGLPEEADVPGHWRGVGFGLGGRRLVSAFDEVVEIMRMPQITNVPGTQPWMLGVANVRGTLLPVVDLKQFLEGERTVIHEGQRVLVVRQGGGNVAVLIDQLFGQRSFNDSQKTSLADDDSRYGHFVRQMYRVGDYDWGVFSMSMLARTPEFRQAAA